MTGILVGSDSYRIESRLPENETEELLLLRAGAGDPAAFLEIYERHRSAVFRFAYRLSGTVETAEDITHDCFLSLIRSPENFRAGRGTLRTYLLSAARNLWFKQLRKLGRESAIDEFGDDEFVAVERPPLRSLLDDELSLKVKEAVSSLPPLQREALILFEYEELSLSDIGDLVGADVTAVKARLFRARQRLKTTLEPYLNTGREIVTLGKA
ncbi:MAG TPA: RNA polymerase sigma factor [Pyrinomonadaceae bacterium]|nr:RNA polymerase sigma factor [Pyrinomonadaceae bacterium]